jgi:hypothetical protein
VVAQVTFRFGQQATPKVTGVAARHLQIWAEVAVQYNKDITHKSLRFLSLSLLSFSHHIFLHGFPHTYFDVKYACRALHEKEEKRMSQGKFCLIALICSFTWYTVPGYFFSTLTNISWVCWAFSKSITAQQIGSGMQGLGVGAVTLDWAAVASFLFNPFFSIVNIFVGYILIVYVAIPIAYGGLDLYSASRFPIFSSHLFTSQGQQYNISAIVNDKFELDLAKYEEQGPIHLSMFFALTYGFGFATVAATLTHVAFFYGRYVMYLLLSLKRFLLTRAKFLQVKNVTQKSLVHLG